MVEYNVAADIKIYLDNPSKSKSVKLELDKLVKVQVAKEEELGFGIKILKVTILMNDDQGGMDQLEEKIKSLENVSEVETENIRRV